MMLHDVPTFIFDHIEIHTLLLHTLQYYVGIHSNYIHKMICSMHSSCLLRKGGLLYSKMYTTEFQKN